MIHDHLKRHQLLPIVPAATIGAGTSRRTERVLPGRTEPVTPTVKLAPAVFLDRDGTLIEDNGSLRSPAQAVFYPEAIPALLRLQPRFRLFIVTNQSGVAKGELTIQEVNEVNDFVVRWLRLHGVQIGAVYCCPHQRTDNCACIKPKPFFLEQAAREHGLDLQRSFVIGDHPHDVELARNAGATGIYVLTGHGLRHRPELRGDAVVTANIAAAAEWILNSIAGAAPHVPAQRQQAIGQTETSTQSALNSP